MGRGDGVEVRPSSIRLFFVHKGERIRETLTRNGRPLKPTAPNIAHAHRVAAQIRKAIELDTFSFSEFFPDSLRAEQAPANTFGQLADAWLASKGGLAEATQDQYRNGVAMWKGLLGADTPIAALTHAVLAKKLGEHQWASAKSFNNYLIPLRGIMGMEYRGSRAIDDPMIGIENRQVVKGPPDPLSLVERDAVLVDMRKRYDTRIWAYFQFAFFAGMRPEELIALQWGDIDRGAGTIRVQRVRTFRGTERDETKTKQIRDVDLTPMALEALAAMEPLTRMKRDDIFENPVTRLPFHDERSQRDHYWAPTLKRLGIRARRAYATRHTYCTAALMAGVPPAYIAAQAGNSVQVLLTRYAKWLPGADGGAARSLLMAAMGGEQVPPKFPNDDAVIGRRDWTRTSSGGATGSDSI